MKFPKFIFWAAIYLSASGLIIWQFGSNLIPWLSFIGIIVSLIASIFKDLATSGYVYPNEINRNINFGMLKSYAETLRPTQYSKDLTLTIDIVTERLNRFLSEELKDSEFELKLHVNRIKIGSIEVDWRIFFAIVGGTYGALAQYERAKSAADILSEKFTSIWEALFSSGDFATNAVENKVIVVSFNQFEKAYIEVSDAMRRGEPVDGPTINRSLIDRGS